MKRIEAIVRPEQLEAVKAAVVALGHHGVTISEVRGHGVQRGVVTQWQDRDYAVRLLAKVSMVAVVHDHEAHDTVEAIVAAARTGQMGDGKIFVTPVEQVIRVRTGEQGPDAL